MKSHVPTWRSKDKEVFIVTDLPNASRRLHAWELARCQDFRLLNHVLFEQRRPNRIKQKLVSEPVRCNVAIAVEITDWNERWGYSMWNLNFVQGFLKTSSNCKRTKAVGQCYVNNECWKGNQRTLVKYLNSAIYTKYLRLSVDRSSRLINYSTFTWLFLYQSSNDRVGGQHTTKNVFRTQTYLKGIRYNWHWKKGMMHKKDILILQYRKIQFKKRKLLKVMRIKQKKISNLLLQSN